MCGLCGLLGQVHWTDTSAHPAAFTDDRRRTFRAERARRVAVVNAALKPYRMKVSDFEATNYVLSTATGGRAIVDDVQAVWGKVDDFLGRPVDPLDPDWLEAIQATRDR
ncbi:MAG: hypothetical protein AAF414_05895 [Pseudomonadota bacterium]